MDNINKFSTGDTIKIQVLDNINTLYVVWNRSGVLIKDFNNACWLINSKFSIKSFMDTYKGFSDISVHEHNFMKSCRFVLFEKTSRFLKNAKC